MTINSLEFMMVSVLRLSLHHSQSSSQSAFCLSKCLQQETSNIWHGPSCCEERFDGSQSAQRAHLSL